MSNKSKKFKNLLVNYQNEVCKDNENENEEKDINYFFLELVSNTGNIIENIEYSEEYCKESLCLHINNTFYCLAQIANRVGFLISEVMEILDPISVNTVLNDFSSNIKYLSFINGKLGEEIKNFCLKGETNNYILKNRIMEVITVLRNICNLFNIKLDDILGHSLKN